MPLVQGISGVARMAATVLVLTEFGRTRHERHRGTDHGTGGCAYEHLHVSAKTLASRIFPDSSGARPLPGLMRA